MLNNITATTIFEAFEEACKKNPQKEAIYFKENNSYRCLTYQDLYNRSLQFACFLKKNGIKKGDPVAIILENCHYWPIAFLGIMYIGAIAVPLCPQVERSELEQLIKHSGTKLILTSENSKQKVLEATQNLALGIFSLDRGPIFQNSDPLTQKETIREIFPDTHIASIVYTSGTTAQPKGVILTHHNFMSNAKSCLQLNVVGPDDCLISILPLHHTYPFMVNLLVPLIINAKISFPHSLGLDEIFHCLTKTRVTILVAVPRIYALLSEKISGNIHSQKLSKRLLLKLLLKLALPLRNAGINLSALIMHDLHKKLGSSLRLMVSGGAKLNNTVAKNFYAWGFTVLEGYGLTEASPIITFNSPAKYRLGSVGKPIAGVKVKINEPDESGIGEVIAAGENITSGYYNDMELSKQTIKDGWLYTRDLGYIDKDGFLFITGRKNETIVLSSGKKINPEELELYYNKSHYIEEICVLLPKIAQEKDTLMAVIKPNLDYFRSQGVAQIKDKIRFEIENLSTQLPGYKRIKKYTLIHESLPKTILGKLKRFEIEKKFSQEAVYNEEEPQEEELLPQDTLLLASVISKEVIQHLSNKVKRPVKLSDHLELDLGLDSLERISLFFELQKLMGQTLDEKLFFSVATVKDVLTTVQVVSGTLKPQEKAATWKEILSSSGEKLKKDITIKFTPLQILVNLLLQLILVTIGRCFFLLKVKGKENIPLKGPFIFCPNHASYLDPPLFAAALDSPVLLNTYFLGFSAYINSPFLSWAKKLCRLIPIDPASHLTDTLIACGYVLNNAKILCMFPEGGRSIDGELKEFKRGVGIFIKELNVPVVPVIIRGAHKAWPLGKTFPKPGKVEIIFGKKLAIEDLSVTTKDGIDIYQNIAYNLRSELLKLQKTQ